MLKPITTPSTNSIQQQQTQQILSEPSTPNSTTTQNTDQSSILSPTSPNQLNLQNFQLNQTSQQKQDEISDLLRQFSLIQMFNKQQQQNNNLISSNDLLINNNNLNQPNYNQQQYSNNSNQTMINDELTNLFLNNVELNNNNPLAMNNNIIGNTSSNNLQFANDSLLGINQNLHQNSQFYQQHQTNLNSYQQSNLSNLQQQTTNINPLNFSSTTQQINRIKPRSVHIMCKFGKLGQSSGCLSSPHGFCLGVDEEIVIADTFNHRICIFEKTGQFKHQFGSPGKEDGQLWYPRKVGLINRNNESPRYVVCDRGSERSRMQIFSKDGQFMHRISIKYVDIVAGLVVTSDGLIVVVDSVSATLFVIREEDGKALHKIECKSYMTEPSDIAVFRNHFYICDFKGHCVVVFNSDGQFVRRIGNDKITNYPNGIDITNNGDIVIGDSHGNKFHIVVYNQDGKFLREFECSAAKVSRCCGLRITKEGYIVTLAKNNHHVLILDALFNLSNTNHNQQSNNSSIQNQSFANKTNQLLSFLNNNNNNTSSTTSSQLNGHSSSKEDIDFDNFDALFNLSNGQLNQQPMINSLIQNQSFVNKTNQLPFLNNTSTTSSQLLNGHNSTKEDIDFGILDAVTQNNLMNLLALCDQSVTTNDRNDSTVSDLNSSIIDSITTSPIPQSGKTSNLFLDSNISALQPQFNNNHNNSSKAKNIMTIEHKFGHLGSGKGEFSSPHGFCIGHEDEIIIADTFNHRICVFNQTGEYLYEFGNAGKEEGELWHPRKIAVTKIQASASCHEQRQHLIDQTKFVVCDRGNEKSRMQIFSRSGQFIRKISITYIDIVAGLAITPSNNIVAVDSVQPTVFLIEEEGKLIRWFDTSSHMREPSDIAVNGDLLYICDFKGHQVVVFNDQGVFLRTIGNESITKFPNGINIANNGDIIVGDSHGNRFHVVVFNKNGKALKEFECPYVKVSRCCGLKLTGNGNIVTLAKNNHHVLVLRGISLN